MSAGIFMHGEVGGLPVLGLALMKKAEYLAAPREWRWLSHLVGAMAWELLAKVFQDGGYHHTRSTRIIPKVLHEIELAAAKLAS